MLPREDPGPCLAVLLLVAPPLGAIQVPQTREEFVRVVAAGARGVKMRPLHHPKLK